jgi:hypothetical protein
LIYPHFLFIFYVIFQFSTELTAAKLRILFLFPSFFYNVRFFFCSFWLYMRDFSHY